MITRRAAGVRALLLGGLLTAAPALAVQAHGGGAEEPVTPKPAGRASNAARDALFFLDGSPGMWTASETALGCFLLSPARSGGVRIALGQHVTYGVGLFLIGLALSAAPDDPGEAITLAAGGRQLALKGRIVARDVVFVPLSRSDLDLALREIWYAGTLWVTVRQTELSQGGHGPKDAVEAYSRECRPKVASSS